MLFKKLLGCCLVALATIAPYNTSNHKDSKPSFEVRNICRNQLFSKESLTLQTIYTH